MLIIFCFPLDAFQSIKVAMTSEATGVCGEANDPFVPQEAAFVWKLVFFIS